MNGKATNVEPENKEQNQKFDFVVNAGEPVFDENGNIKQMPPELTKTFDFDKFYEDIARGAVLEIELQERKTKTKTERRGKTSRKSSEEKDEASRE